MGERCNNCKVSFRSGGDTWCIGCSAWETIGLELCGRWPGPPGVRRIADDIALSAARHIRALRSFGAGIGPAPSDQGAGLVKEEKGEDRKAGSREVPGLAAKAKAVDPYSEYEYTYSEGEEVEKEEARSAGSRRVDPRPALERKTRSESEKRPDKHRGEERTKVKEEKGFEEDRPDKRPRTPERRDQKRRGEEEERKKSKKKEKKEGSGKRKKRRGGRKHQQVSRLAADPFRPVHRRLGGQTLEGGGSLDLHRAG